MRILENFIVRFLFSRNWKVWEMRNTMRKSGLHLPLILIRLASSFGSTWKPKFTLALTLICIFKVPLQKAWYDFNKNILRNICASVPHRFREYIILVRPVWKDVWIHSFCWSNKVCNAATIYGLMPILNRIESYWIV